MKRYELNNRVIAITGSTGGLGLAVANAPGLARKLVERAGFDDARVAQAMALEPESKTRQSMKESA